jgi:XTP/dITP diphosphohydrolase
LSNLSTISILVYMKIFLASRNNHKAEEIAAVFINHQIITLPDSIELQETGMSFRDNAFQKAEIAFKHLKEPVLADDSGLVVPALNGEPGIYSARYGREELGNSANDRDRYNYLLERMKGVSNRTAYFVCCMVLIRDYERFYVVQETVAGEILTKPQGHQGFGYDPVFFIPELDKTMAELTADEKNQISHRGRALAELKKLL